MKKEKQRKTPNVYESHGYYYFKLTIDGVRKTISTGAHSKRAAEEYRDTWLKTNFDESEIRPRAMSAKGGTPRTLKDLMDMFLIPEQNPKFISAKVTGENYGEARATAVARHMRQAEEAVPTYYTRIPLRKLATRDMDSIRAAIHKAYGNTCKAQDVFKSLKAVLTYASQKGWISVSPSSGMKDIKAVKGEPIIVIDHNQFRKIHSHREWFPSDMAQDIFFLLATTGMRHGEFSALQGKQFKTVKIDGEEVTVVNICQAWKDDHHNIGLPKWDKQRIIPLAPDTASIFRRYVRGKEDFLFHPKDVDILDMFHYLQMHIDSSVLDMPDLVHTLTPKAMRHSLNTVLRTEDANDVLIQEYMSWHHQDENKVQQGYTHIYVKNLTKISKKIQLLYSSPVEEEAEELDDGFITFD